MMIFGIIAITMQIVGLIGLILVHLVLYPKNDATADVRLRMWEENKELFEVLPPYTKMFWSMRMWSYQKWEVYCNGVLNEG